MARRRKGGAQLTLFSFMDIMTTFMATLLLVLISNTLVSITSKKKEIYIKIKTEAKETAERLPVYVDCQAKKVVILPDNLETPYNELEREDQGSNFFYLLSNLDRNKEYLIFSVRPTGIETFKKARAIAEKMDISLGFEPVDAEWKIRMDKKALGKWGAISRRLRIKGKGEQ